MCGISFRRHGNVLPLHRCPATNDELDAFRREPAKRRTHFLISAFRDSHVAGQHRNRVWLRRLGAAPGRQQQTCAFTQERRSNAERDETNERRSSREHCRPENPGLIHAIAVGHRMTALDGVLDEPSRQHW